MSRHPESREEAGRNFVSTGHLPSPQLVKALMFEAYERFKVSIRRSTRVSDSSR